MSGRIFIFLDYDGTLVPIRSTPGKAVITAKARLLLRELSENPALRVAIVTGRSLRNIKSIIGLEGLTYAGNHGLEIEGPGIPYRSMAGGEVPGIMSRISGALHKELASVKGILIENKGLTLSLHFRLVDRKMLPSVHAAFGNITGPYVKMKKITISPGKKVLEAKPAVRWDKGRAVLEIMKKLREGSRRVFAVYIGDDATDEAAFKALAKRGMTIKVGGGAETRARYRIKNPSQVLEFLDSIKEACCDGQCGKIDPQHNQRGSKDKTGK